MHSLVSPGSAAHGNDDFEPQLPVQAPNTETIRAGSPTRYHSKGRGEWKQADYTGQCDSHLSPAELLSGLGHFIFFRFFSITAAAMIENDAAVSAQIWREGSQEESGMFIRVL